MIIECEDLFKEKLKNGINLFTGAGFSTLPNDKGETLPMGRELGNDLLKVFNITVKNGMSLEDISTIIEASSSHSFQQYLRKRYYVESYNPLYDVINKINMKSYITTNIDNLIQCVMDNSKSFYLRNAVQYGASKNAPYEVQFIPLHGNVLDYDSHLYFGKFDLAVADQYNHNLFEIMFSLIKQYPTLFWGYGFHDDGVKKVLARLIKEKRQDIWIVCLEDGDLASVFRALGCHIIIGTTEGLFKWIDEKIDELSSPTPKNSMPECLKKYFIPSANSVAVVPKKDYYLNSQTNWYNIISNHAYDRKELSEIENAFLTHKNIIIDGIPFSGKTSILMQLALKIDNNFKLFCSDLTMDFSNFIIKNTKSLDECIIFIDECSDDMEAYSCLAKAPNIKTIATAESFAFESSKHLLPEEDFYRFEIDELTQTEAQGIFNKIPEKVRTDVMHYKDNSEERFGMLEMMSKNVENIVSEERVYRVLKKAHNNNFKVFEIIAVTAYLTSNKSLASIDIFMSYFDETYSIVNEYVKQAQELLSDITLENDDIDENYYVLRSHLFAVKVNEILLKKYQEDYSKIIRRFIKNTNSFTIYKHYVFRRSAYDASFFYKLYKDKADDIYKSIYDYDGNAYTLQQWALYLLQKGDNMGAFAKIDEAISLNPNNYSIRNTHAIILFEVNKNIRSEQAHEELKKAMTILQDCYRSDKRKNYHAQKFAEYAIFLNRELGDNSYLETALEWINNIISADDIKSKKNLRLKDFLEKSINNIA